MKLKFLIAFILMGGLVSAQQKYSVVQQAMLDELERNMKELKSEGNGPPFFINYTIEDRTTYQVFAYLGAVSSSGELRSRTPISIRLLVGDYDFNDESLDEPTYTESQSADIAFPIDDDYLGIRRSLWIATDNAYRNACRQFSKNKEALKTQDRPLAELPHRSFAKVPPSNVNVDFTPPGFELKQAEDFLRAVTVVGVDYPEVVSVSGYFSYSVGHRYQVNSEGSNNRLPISEASLTFELVIRNQDGEYLFDELEFSWAKPSFPPLEETRSRVRKMLEALLQSSKAEKFTEEYVGPVLFLDNNVETLFQEALLGNLMHSNHIPSLSGGRGARQQGLESKIGKPVFASSMTVVAAPRTGTFAGQELPGGYLVDSEGVIPADETILIENGILKELMNDRTLTRSDQKPNGLGDGFGVAIVRFNNGVPLSDLKSRLIEQARKDALDYGVMIRRNHGPRRDVFDVYKVYVADGHEEYCRNAMMNPLSQRDFRKILASSTEQSLYRIEGRSGSANLVCPTGVLLEEVELKPSEDASEREQVYVPSPLKK